MHWQNALLWAAGFVGFGGFVSGAHATRRYTRFHAFFRFQREEAADVVLPTSDRGVGGFGGVEYVRTTTSVGNLRGATDVAQAIGYRSRKRQITVVASTEVETPLDGDLVLIGLPGKNPVTALLLDSLRERYADLDLEVHETDEPRMRLGETTVPYLVRAQSVDCPIPERDIAVVAMWVNPLTTKKRRLIWCAGFTAYGTAAAAEYVTDDLYSDRYSTLREEHPHALPRLFPWRSAWPCFVAILDVRLVNDQAVSIREIAFRPLEDPGTPPFSPASPETTKRLVNRDQRPMSRASDGS